MINSHDMPNATTGRHIITFRPGLKPETMTRLLSKTAGIRAVLTSDGATAADMGPDFGFGTAGLVFDTIGSAVVEADDDQTAALTTAAARWGGRIKSIEPELWMRTLGYRDTAEQTWGLQAVNVRDSSRTGTGIKIAVLDTGIDPMHADISGREWIGESFATGEDYNDGHGHGTHCIGTAMGLGSRVGTVRYGVAPGAMIYAGKVLSSQGFGQDGWILAGIEWAIRTGVQVISMSLGADVRRGAPHSAAYEAAAKAALDAGCLIVAAAGNAGNAPVGAPANCPSVLAVAAVGQGLLRAPFSSIGYNDHKHPDIAAPGVDVLSSVPAHQSRTGYVAWSGTSMATPHVAGCAALWAEATGARGRDLWRVLVDNARRLGGQTSEHVGAGLVQVPA